MSYISHIIYVFINHYNYTTSSFHYRPLICMHCRHPISILWLIAALQFAWQSLTISLITVFCDVPNEPFNSWSNTFQWAARNQWNITVSFHKHNVSLLFALSPRKQTNNDANTSITYEVNADQLTRLHPISYIMFAPGYSQLVHIRGFKVLL